MSPEAHAISYTIALACLFVAFVAILVTADKPHRSPLLWVDLGLFFWLLPIVVDAWKTV